ncbi:MAG TPA: GDSL-type esterase/lipase family protein [Syntrophorhabdaceae bacterium]|nr:GDSL-type esterase/lipase family protein [Syntrophorhabdaceae bacterium]
MAKKNSILIKVMAVLIIIVICLLALEAAGQVIFRLKNGYWLFKHEDDQYRVLFRKHPFLIAEPRPDTVYITKNNLRFSHNNLGLRGKTINVQKKQGIKRIAVLGGSSTYCTGVSDNETWPFFLEKELGANYEVLNYGVPGYTTVEHIIQSALNLSDLSPVMCIYYIGWNDMRNVHVAGLRSDYSDFHGRSQHNHLLLGSLKFGNHSMLIITASNLLKKIFVQDPEGVFTLKGNPDLLTDKIDMRALSLYKRNIKLLISLCRAQGIRPVFVPQIMNFEKLTGDKPYGWLPFVKDKDLKAITEAYNKALQEVCLKEKADFIKDVLDVHYTQKYFVDNLGHFSPYGNQEFARIIAEYIIKK